MTQTQILEMKEKTQAYHARIISKGGKLTTYQCPHCRQHIPTVQPRQDQVDESGYWSSAKSCIECGEVSFVTTGTDGNTNVQVL